VCSRAVLLMHINRDAVLVKRHQITSAHYAVEMANGVRLFLSLVSPSLLTDWNVLK
jgi:hypothetical protein